MDHSRARRIAQALESWFETNPRDLPWRATYDPWQVLVSETMLQQTRMRLVLAYFSPFIERFPTATTLASADEEEVVAMWSGLGYYRRARSLHAAAREIVTHHGGCVPSDYEALRRLPGVGAYTAGAVSSIAFGLPVEAADGNVERLLSRLETLDHVSGSGGSMRAVRALARDMVGAADSPRAVNQAAMEVGSTICLPKTPRCGSCPVEIDCLARASGDPAAWPRRSARTAQRMLVVPLLVVRDPAGRILLMRGGGALLGGMFHLPHASSELDASLDVRPRFSAGPRLASFRHSITNLSIEFVLHEGMPRRGEKNVTDGADSLWIHPTDLAGIPHSSYVRKAFRTLEG